MTIYNGSIKVNEEDNLIKCFGCLFGFDEDHNGGNGELREDAEEWYKEHPELNKDIPFDEYSDIDYMNQKYGMLYGTMPDTKLLQMYIDDLIGHDSYYNDYEWDYERNSETGKIEFLTVVCVTGY